MVGTRSCPLCREVLAPPSKSSRFYEDELFVAFPANSALSHGHSLLVPRRHVEAIGGLKTLELEDLGPALAIVATRLQRLSRDFTVSLNHGPVAGQEEPHIHFHVIPRYVDGVGSLAPGRAWGYDAPRKRVSPRAARELAAVLR